MIEYQKMLRKIMEIGERHEGRNGPTISHFGDQMVFDLREGFPLVTTKRIPYRWVVMELMWMLAGSTDEKELNARGVRTWEKWSDSEENSKYGRKPGDLGPTYGWLIRNFGGTYMPTSERRLMSKLEPGLANGHDQLWELAYRMDTEPNSRRLIVSQWDPVSVHELAVPPCQPLWQVRLHEPHLANPAGVSLRVDVRSQDAFIGLPFDIAHYATLLSLLGYCTSREPRYLVMQFGDIHIYEEHLPQVNELLEREPRPRPRMTITKPLYHAVPGAAGQDTYINMLQFSYDHVLLEGYDPWPAIKAEVAV